MEKPHILAIPYPFQGHVLPLMQLSLKLVEHGFKVTFVNTEAVHKRVVSAFSEEDNVEELINLVSVPDGLDPEEDRNDIAKLTQAMFRVMPGELEQLVRDINRADDKITCIIADETMGWALEFADRFKIKRAAFWPASAALLALKLSIPKLIQDGFVDNDGNVLRSEMFTLSTSMPVMNSKDFAWTSAGDSNAAKIMFRIFEGTNRTVKLAERIISNTSYELEPAALSLFPEILAIGPFLADNRLGKSSGSFWRADASCLAWLDQQPNQSVIYVAFGSFTIFDQKQFHELATGLEHTNRPFLWVVRTDMMDGKSEDFLKIFKVRIGQRGRIVGWAPQQAVLNHPAIGCFLSHCGWNSTIEGVSNGVPFLSWPYFADQFLNQTYICDVWKVGLALDKDETGIITRGEIENKVEKLLNDKTFKQRALIYQEMVISGAQESGCSNKNMSNFIQWIKY
ncbi:hypothetical protein DCAR_0935831 [Daucus carota subsp. sativus]|uniref:UDP-glycosyltransferase n=1 Tax=Daucus carota subsp. sativus TaxID=79200 RepID=A0AAF1BKR6_DAUCS|nr:PREDICTED: UDP-glycosyltransferase 83A1-like [Daucus carota subsp. sativus]WOH16281.1 hypothetical protein DCAR_0935831 [Daucus carota subsp. sativus]